MVNVKKATDRLDDHQTPRPSTDESRPEDMAAADALRERYEREGATTQRYDSSSYWDRRYHVRRFEEVTGTLARLLEPGASFLDVGCGTGEYVRWAADRGAGATNGVDLAEEYCERTRALVPTARVERCDASALPFADQEVDVVLCSEVIEHIPYADQARVVQELQRVTRRHLVITTPNTGAALRVLARRLARGKVAELDDEVGHIALLRRAELVALALRTGWVVEPVRVHHITPPVIGELLRLPSALDRTAHVVERAADRVVSRAGNAMIMVCTRV
ncbi:MAG: methyltransferase domain-containing protein [Actinobacteria bacterium]|jgi:2-polyprenyl-3-methyl-5-hydroxy-6-metoxy-1,4-benzoquinol methylase|uniref:Unannotated protein n=1 Tax=freshwater metagenome TaxID=449393 RepID=A0A6J6CXV6_9ZZZZ|nr:methyltransferase domain-containing protein [Actinomycetota bacterium]